MMLIPLTRAIADHAMKIKGIVHVGAHWGQELQDYWANGIQDIVFIEPDAEVFQRLETVVAKDPRIVLYNCACADWEGHGDLYTERMNQGQSSSLLKPKKHLEHYPSIRFDTVQRVPVRTLDSLPFMRNKYNLLMMDTQGSELMVLKGAVDTLRSIDYVYTEVNNQELYQGCAQVEELDAFLTGFTRVETHWVRQHGWGDAIYRRNNIDRL